MTQIDYRELGLEIMNLMSNGEQNNNSNLLIPFSKMYFEYKNQYISTLQEKSKAYLNSLIMISDKFFKKELTSLEEMKNRYAETNLNKKYMYLSLRNWLRFCEDQELIDDIIIHKIKKFVKQPKKGKLDIFVPTKEEINELIKEVKNYNHLDYIGLKILIESGLRLKEIEYFFKTFNEKNVEINNDIVIYSLFHLRGKKNSYYLFMTKELYYEFLLIKDLFSTYKFYRIQTHIKRRKLTPLKYTRKFNFTLMIHSGISFEIANFIQGRTSSNMGFNHYLAKKEIAIKEYNKILR